MLDTLKDFLRSLGGTGAGRADADDDPRIAAAALLFHVSEADGASSPAERETLRVLLATEYRLDGPQLAEIEAAGRRADADAVDLFRFTTVLMRHLSEAERIRFVEFLWEIVYVDGDVHELEDNIVWRVADLLGVSSRDRMLAKRDALARRKSIDV